jgi:DNA-3-methyladenine glycosylase II
LTVEALRRVSANVVDVVTPDGCYMRAFSDAGGTNIVEVRQRTSREIEVRIAGRGAERRLDVVKHMLGTGVDLSAWYVRATSFPWLARVTQRLRGVKPPRYPDLWEAICHGIVFQQISIVAAGAIMQRLVMECSLPVEHAGVTLYLFPLPQAILDAPVSRLRTLGLSSMKAAYLQGAADAIVNRAIDPRRIASLPTPAAADELCKLKGIGPWSAAVVLLRGLGRLDTFPLKDSGALGSIGAVSGAERIDIHRVLTALGDVRGMLYFHLLLGRRYLDGPLPANRVLDA